MSNISTADLSNARATIKAAEARGEAVGPLWEALSVCAEAALERAMTLVPRRGRRQLQPGEERAVGDYLSPERREVTATFQIPEDQRAEWQSLILGDPSDMVAMISLGDDPAYISLPESNGEYVTWDGERVEVLQSDPPARVRWWNRPRS